MFAIQALLSNDAREHEAVRERLRAWTARSFGATLKTQQASISTKDHDLNELCAYDVLTELYLSLTREQRQTQKLRRCAVGTHSQSQWKMTRLVVDSCNCLILRLRASARRQCDSDNGGLSPRAYAADEYCHNRVCLETQAHPDFTPSSACRLLLG